MQNTYACTYAFIYCGNLGSAVSKTDTLKICLENQSKAENVCVRHGGTSTCVCFCSHELVEDEISLREHRPRFN